LNKTWSVVLAGSGGQGLGLTGQILAEAALTAGLHAVHNQSFGARARGGYSQSSVIISPEEIIYPFVETPDLVIALSQGAYDLNLPLMAARGLMFYDNNLVKGGSGPNLIGFPFAETARRANNSLGVALVALGTAAGVTGLVSEAGLLKALKAHFNGTGLERNSHCVTLGVNLGK